MEKRKPSPSKASSLPDDYLEMVNEVFSSHFDAGLKIYEKEKPEPRFETHGDIFQDEIVVSSSLLCKGQLAATTVYASVDFDPKASAPSVQDLLSACVDAIGSVFGTFITPEHPEGILELDKETFSSLDNIPFEWTLIESNQKQIYVKMDKSNPNLDSQADEWLKRNDSELKNSELEEQKETENLFFTGPKRKTDSDIH